MTTYVQWSSEPAYTSPDPIWQSVNLPYLPLDGRNEAAIRTFLDTIPRKQSGEFGWPVDLPSWQADWGSGIFPEADRWPWLQQVNVPLSTAAGGTLRLAARARAKYAPNTAIVGQWAISAPITVGALNGNPLGAQFVFPGERGVYMPGDTVELVILADLAQPGSPTGNGLLHEGDLLVYGFESNLLIFGGSSYDVRYFPPVGGTITVNGLRSNTAMFGWRLSESSGTPEPTLITLRNTTSGVRRLTSLAVSVQPTGGGSSLTPSLSVDSATAPGTAGSVQGGLLTFPLDLLVQPEELVHLWVNPGTGYSLIPADQTYFAPQLGVAGTGAQSDWLVMEGAYTLSRELYFTSESVGSDSEVLLNSLIDGYSGAAQGQVPTKGVGGRLVWRNVPSGGDSGGIEASDLPGYDAAQPGQVLTRTVGGVGWTSPTGGGGGGSVESLIQSVTAALRQPQSIQGFTYASPELHLDTAVDGFGVLQARTHGNLSQRHLSIWALGAPQLVSFRSPRNTNNSHATPRPIANNATLSTTFTLNSPVTFLGYAFMGAMGLGTSGGAAASYELRHNGAVLHSVASDTAYYTGNASDGALGLSVQLLEPLALPTGDYELRMTLSATGALASDLNVMIDSRGDAAVPVLDTGFATESRRLLVNGLDVGINRSLAATVQYREAPARLPVTTQITADGLMVSGDGFVMAAQPLDFSANHSHHAIVEFTVTPVGGEHFAFSFLPGRPGALTADPLRLDGSILNCFRGLDAPGDASNRPMELRKGVGIVLTPPLPVGTRLRLEIDKSLFPAVDAMRLYNAGTTEKLWEGGATADSSFTRLVLALTNELPAGSGTNLYDNAEQANVQHPYYPNDYGPSRVVIHRWVEWRETS